MTRDRFRTASPIAALTGTLVIVLVAGAISLPGRALTAVAHAAIIGDTAVRPSVNHGPRERPRGSKGRTHRRAAASASHLLVAVSHDLIARARPEAGAAVIGKVPAGSRYYDVPMTAWVEEVSDNGRWGRVELPYVWPRREGWILLPGLRRDRTFVEVHVDLSRHRITVQKRGEVLFGGPTATGAAASPTPVGEYFVTDRVPFSGGYLGTFAFGISGIQPHLPAGWSGGDQLAIHGTNDPSSIGTSASAGCLRVSERMLDRLKPLLRLGTPVLVER